MGQLRDVVPRRRINSQLRKGSVAPTELYALNTQPLISYLRESGFSSVFLARGEENKLPVAVEQIDGMIHTIRGMRVMLDCDLAQIYGVPTFRFNEAIKRNPESFRGSRRISCFNSRARSSIPWHRKMRCQKPVRWPAHSPLRVY